ncbi:hypothetical protein V6C32_11425 [Desulforamulus ruminis]|uniref:hypothetical protein n=1 Tax=Desulforamulus ruminis TaxID=1564 RepID=UPI002FD8B486
MAKLSFTKWPFLKDEKVILHWLRSPWMEGRNKQWMMKAVFERADGTLRGLKIPWGALPYLYLGQEFANGKPTGAQGKGKGIKIKFFNDLTCNIYEAGKPIKPWIYKLHSRENLQEQCAVINNRNQIIVIPCLELIRFFFVFNKVMAHAILQPNSFNEIIRATIENDCINMYFHQKVVYSTITEEIVRLFALIFFHDAWSSSWKSVWNERIKQSINNRLKIENVIPLMCVPPMIKGTIWDVKAVENGKTIIVLEIKSVSYYQPFPFNEITYYHPKSASPVRVPLKRKAIFSQSKQAETMGLDQTTKTPTKLTQPAKIETTLPNHNFMTIARVKQEIKKERLVRTGPADKNSTEGRGVIAAPKNSSVSLNDEAGKGSIQAAEFLPISQGNFEYPNFQEFFRAINLVTQLRPELEFSCLHSKVPDFYVFPKSKLHKRPFFLLRAPLGGKEVFILEFDLSDGHCISTILFLSLEKQKTMQAFLKKLFRNYIIGRGSWDKQSLKSSNMFRVQLAKHTTQDAYRWGKRLIDKIEDLVSYI